MTVLPKLKSNMMVTNIADELLVYDADLKKAHCLSQVGMIVYKACEKGLDREDLLTELFGTGVVDAKAALDETLNQFASEGLLLNSTDKPFDRRRFLQAAGAVVAVPILASVLAPRPSQATSCSECQTNAGIPKDCTNCGQACRSTIAASCTGKQICAFKYTNHPAAFPRSATCASFFSNATNAGQGDYQCQGNLGIMVYKQGLTFFPNCQQARQSVFDNNTPGPPPQGTGDNGQGESFYCCQCDGSQSTYSCP